jgi:hypothetical protein
LADYANLLGDCCSPSNYCGSTSGHCGTGCQASFGTCSSTPTSATASRPSDVSTDGSCGGSKNLKCQGRSFGDCCSKGGFCGNTVNHCAQGCQTKFSSKCLTSNIPTLDGSCGSKVGLTCAGGPFDGMCCSSGGFCGSTNDHCKTGWYVFNYLTLSGHETNRLVVRGTMASVHSVRDWYCIHDIAHKRCHCCTTDTCQFRCWVLVATLTYSE